MPCYGSGRVPCQLDLLSQRVPFDFIQHAHFHGIARSNAGEVLVDHGFVVRIAEIYVRPNAVAKGSGRDRY